MNKISIILKKYLKINLVLFFVFGFFLAIIVENKNIIDIGFETDEVTDEVISDIKKEPDIVSSKLEDLSKEKLIVLFKEKFEKSSLKIELFKFQNEEYNDDFSKNISIESLGNNKYLVGTNDKGFYLLEFNNENDTFTASKIIKNDGGEITELTNSLVALRSSIQFLENNKYLVGTNDKGFYLLEFNNENDTFTASKIKGSNENNEEISDLTTDDDVGEYSSIQFLENNKYLVGTSNKGFYLLEFNNENNTFTASKIKGSNENNEEISDLRKGYVGNGSSIEFLENNKYLVVTQKDSYLFEFNNKNNRFTVSKIKNEKLNEINYLEFLENKPGGLILIKKLDDINYNKYLILTNKGFYLFEFNNGNDTFIVSKIKNEKNEEISVEKIGFGSSIQFLGNNKYLVGTNTGFHLFKFNNNNSFTTSKIKSKNENNQEISNLTSENIGNYSSIQKLGDKSSNKYFIGTNDKGFYLLEFDIENDLFITSKIKNIIWKKSEISNIFLKKLLNEIAKSWITNQFFWKDFFEIFDTTVDGETIPIKENLNFDNFNKKNLINLIKLIVVFDFKNPPNNIRVSNQNQNIIRLAKWLKKEDQFNNLLGIKDSNPLTFNSFSENGNIKEGLINVFSLEEYYDIIIWLDNILLTKKENVFNKIKQKLSNYFNIDIIRKKIAKIIIKINKIPIDFFDDTELTKENFKLFQDETHQIKSNIFWNITLETSAENLNKYKSWIDSLNEVEYIELLIQRINELLTEDKKELISDIKETIQDAEDSKDKNTIDEILEIIELDFSHTDFDENGLLRDNLTKEKLEKIIFLIESFNEEKNIKLLKYITNKWLETKIIFNNFDISFEGKFIKIWIIEIKEKNLIDEESTNKFLGINKKFGFSHINFNNEGLLNDNLTKTNVDAIKYWINNIFFFQYYAKFNPILLKELRTKLKKLIKNNIKLRKIIFDNDPVIEKLESYLKKIEKNWNHLIFKPFSLFTLWKDLKNNIKYNVYHTKMMNLEQRYIIFNNDIKSNEGDIKLLFIEWIIFYSNEIKKILNKNDSEFKNLIKDAKKITGEEDKILGLDESSGFSHIDFKEDGSFENILTNENFNNLTYENFNEYYDKLIKIELIYNFLNEINNLEKIKDRLFLKKINLEIEILLENNDLEFKKEIKKALENKDTADEVLGFNLIDEVTHKDFNTDGSLKEETKKNKEKLEEIKKWLFLKKIKQEITEEIKKLILDTKKINAKEDEILEITELNFSYIDFNDEGLLNENLTTEKLEEIKKWLKKPNLTKNIRKNLILNIFNNRHKNIIKFVLWLKEKNWISEEEFNQLLGIIELNPFSFDSFDSNTYELKENKLDDLSQNQYDTIKNWLDVTNQFFNELIDKENKVIEKIKEKLWNHFNTSEKNLDIRKKIAKLITEIYEVQDNFFSDTGLTKESFGISMNGTGEMISNASWNIELNTTIDILNYYKSWIDSLNEEKYKELLIYKINLLLTNNKKELISDAKESIGKEDEILGFDLINEISHTFFDNKGSLNDNLTIEKLESIKNWLNNFLEINIFKNLIKNIFNNDHKNIIRLAKWLENEDFINRIEFNNLLGIKDNNPINSSSLTDLGNIGNNLFENIDENKYKIIKKWLDISDEISNELIDKTIQVIQKIKGKLVNHFNTFELNLDIRKKIAKLITEMSRFPDNFFKYNFKENEIETGLSKSSFKNTGQIKINATWNIELNTTIDILNYYKSWIDSLDDKKYTELIKYLINYLLKDIKNIIKKAKKNPDTADKILGLNENFGFSHTNFDEDGLLIKNNFNKEKLTKIKNWLFRLKEESNQKNENNRNLILYIALPIFSVILLILIFYFVKKNQKRTKTKIKKTIQ